jgi:hypothetical protein
LGRPIPLHRSRSQNHEDIGGSRAQLEDVIDQAEQIQLERNQNCVCQLPDLDQTPCVHGGEEWHLGPELVAVAIQEDSGGSAHGGDQVEPPFGE